MASEGGQQDRTKKIKNGGNGGEMCGAMMGRRQKRTRWGLRTGTPRTQNTTARNQSTRGIGDEQGMGEREEVKRGGKKDTDLSCNNERMARAALSEIPRLACSV